MPDLLAQSLDDLPWWTQGIYRRAIVLLNEDGASIGAMVDEQHHAIVRLTHESGVITAISGDLLRRPWSTCSSAPDALKHLVGLPLNGLSTRLGRERQQQCNHLLDIVLLLAGLIVAEEAERWYAVDIGRNPNGGFDRVVRLRSSTGYSLDWQVVSDNDLPVEYPTRESPPDDIIVGDPTFDGVVVANLPRHFPPGLPDTARDALFIVRRAIHVAGRSRAESTIEAGYARDFAALPSCFAYQPVRVADGVYTPGMRRDFTQQPTLVFDLLEALRDQISSTSRKAPRAFQSQRNRDHFLDEA